MALKPQFPFFQRGRSHERRTPRALPLDWKGVVIALVKAQGLHDGRWRLAFTFGSPLGTTVNITDHHTGTTQHAPAVAVPFAHLALVETDEVGPFAVDAAVCNPLVAQPEPVA